MRGQNGITLVALIITIVVMLILAVVTISTVQNESLFVQANNAVKAWNEAENNQSLKMENQSDLLQDYWNQYNSIYNPASEG